MQNLEKISHGTICEHFQIMHKNNSWLKPYEVENSSHSGWLQELQDGFLRGRERRIKIFLENHFMSNNLIQRQKLWIQKVYFKFFGN